jgi:hypothetical protein
MLRVSDAVPGPPWLITKMMSKALTASMVRMIAATIRNGSTMGKVMRQKVCQAEAPSSCAAS